MDSRDANVRYLSLASGLLSGVARVCVGHPFDTLKVWTQTAKQTGHAPVSSSFFTSARALRTLYRGVGAPLLSTGATTSLNFALYENARLSLLEYFNVSKEDFWGNNLVIFASGNFSGAVVTVLTSPLDTIKIAKQTSKDKSNIVSWARKIKPYGLFRGFTSNLFCSSVGRGFYLCGYTSTFYFLPKTGIFSSDSVSGKLLAASVAGISGWFFIFPMDVVRSNMMTDWRKEKFTSTLDCIRKMYREGGISSFYKGLRYTLIRAVPVAWVALPVYDFMQTRLISRFAQ